MYMYSCMYMYMCIRVHHTHEFNRCTLLMPRPVSVVCMGLMCIACVLISIKPTNCVHTDKKKVHEFSKGLSQLTRQLLQHVTLV